MVTKIFINIKYINFMNKDLLMDYVQDDEFFNDFINSINLFLNFNYKFLTVVDP